jgi:hypothetical protein
MARQRERIEFRTLADMVAHLDRWADRTLRDADAWTGVLLDSQAWRDYSARNQVLLASYGADGPVAGVETWRLVPSTTPDRSCAVRTGEHGYPVRVPVTTGGSEPDPYLGGTRPTRAQVERWEWRPVFSIGQLARRPAPDSLVPPELPATLTGPDADGEFLAAVRKVATATVRGRLRAGDDPHEVLAAAAGRLRRSAKRPELDRSLRAQVAWLVADRAGLAAKEGPIAFDPGALAPRERWERLQDVLEPARKLTAALGVTVGVDLLASPLPRMEIVDDRVVPAGRRHRLPVASLEQLPIGRWVRVGPYTTAEWASRGEDATGAGAYLRLNRTAYVAAVETGDGAAWRLEDVAARTGHGYLATGRAASLDAAQTDAWASLRDRYPALDQPAASLSVPTGTGRTWEALPGAGRQPAEARQLTDEVTLYVLPGPGGRWLPAIHTPTNRTLEPLALRASRDDARTAAELAGQRAVRIAQIADPARGDLALAEYATHGDYNRAELAALVAHRLDPDAADRVATAAPAELVELLGAAGASPVTTVAILHAEGCDPTIVAEMLPVIGVPMADAIRVLHERWDLPRPEAADLLDATATEMRDAGCTATEIMASRPRDILRTLPDDPHLWELAAGTMATAEHPAGTITAHLAAHAPTPEAFAAGLTTIADATDGLTLAAAHHAQPEQLAAASERYGLSPTETAGLLAGTTTPGRLLDTIAIRCDHDPKATTRVAAAVGVTDSAIEAWRHPPEPVRPIRLGGAELDPTPLLAALRGPTARNDDELVQLLDHVVPQPSPELTESLALHTLETTP